jgi:hypothetical protein
MNQPQTHSPRAAALATCRRAAAALLAIGAAHSVLAATHGGEFWPFSIYPMFSHAGRPWLRALLLEGVSSVALDAEYTLGALPGTPIALEPLGIPQNDLSSLVQRAARWDAAELEALRRLMGALPCERPVLLVSVRGTLGQSPAEHVVTPVAALGCEQGRVSITVASRSGGSPVEETKP